MGYNSLTINRLGLGWGLGLGCIRIYSYFWGVSWGYFYRVGLRYGRGEIGVKIERKGTNI